MTYQNRKRDLKSLNKNGALFDKLYGSEVIDVEYEVKEVKVRFFKDGEFIVDLSVEPLGPSLNEFLKAFEKVWTDFCQS